MFFAPEQTAPKNDHKSVGKVYNPHFGALLAAVPRLRVFEMTASVMPERSEPPNLASNRNARAAVFEITYTFF